MSFNLTLNKECRKEEVESIFDTRFGYGIKGINLRKYKDGRSYIILFSKQLGPYTDEFSENIFSYDGEGVNKNQKLTAANKALIDSQKDGRNIYGFRQDGEKGVWKYIGLLKVIDWEYILKNGFNTYVFKLKRN
jgi:putative restriction endonuclease